jgi:hypothetical protein
MCKDRFAISFFLDVADFKSVRAGWHFRYGQALFCRHWPLVFIQVQGLIICFGAATRHVIVGHAKWSGCGDAA